MKPIKAIYQPKYIFKETFCPIFHSLSIFQRMYLQSIIPLDLILFLQLDF